MTDPLDDLQAALKRQTPAPRDGARNAALRAATEAYDQEFSPAAQGSTAGARPTQDRPDRRAGVWKGLIMMLSTLTQPRYLMGTSAIATVAIAFALTQQIGPFQSGDRLEPVSELAKTAPGTPTEAVEVDALAEGGAVGSRAEPPASVPGLAGLPQSFQDDAAPARGRVSGLVGQSADVAEEAESFDMAIAPPAPALALRERRAMTESPAADHLIAPAPEAPGRPAVESSAEQYPDASPSPLKRVAEQPVSTFSIDVDTTAYAVVRSSLTQGTMPPPAAVRVEEMINYFDYAYPTPEDRDTPFTTSVSVAETPWNPDTRLMHIGIQGYDLAPAERPPLNLVFLIDTSGSMNEPQKLPLLVRSFKLLLETLTEQDSIAIVAYAGSAGMVLAPTPATDVVAIEGALDRLSAGGSTAGEAGLQQAYRLAEQMGAEGEVSRVILATDGDFNVGIADPDALKRFVEDKRETGTYLSVLGFGRGNLNDAVMQSLAQNGNGIAAFIDTLAEAQKVLVEDVTGNLFPIAGDVKIQVEFNPAQVSEYRLIGYETRALKREDFNNDAVDAGDIGAGHSVTALYEVTPVGSAAERVSDLRYGETPALIDASTEYAFVKLRYKRPGEAASTLIETPVQPDRADIALEETQFAAAVAGFGRLLKGDRDMGDWSYADARALAASSRGEDPFGYRSELLGLIRMADALD